MPDTLTLNECPMSEMSVGARGRITRFDGAVEIRQRLREMGLTTGAAVRFIRKAPFGDPIELEVRGYRLSLRRFEAATVLVEPA